MRKANFTWYSYEKIRDIGRCCLLLLVFACANFDAQAQNIEPGDEILFMDGATATIQAQQMNCGEMTYGFFDAGGEGAPFSDEGNTQVFTICPEGQMNQILSVEFTGVFMTQGGMLAVFDGATATGTPMMITAPTTVSAGFDGSMDRTRCLTFELSGQDEISNEEGWTAIVRSTEFANAVALTAPSAIQLATCDDAIPSISLTPDFDCGTPGNPAYLQQITVNGTAVEFVISGTDVNGDGTADNDDLNPATGTGISANANLQNIILLGTQPGPDGILGTGDDIPAALEVGENEVCINVGFDMNGNGQIDAGEIKTTDCAAVLISTDDPLACNDEVNIGLDGNCEITISPDALLESPCEDESSYEITLTLVAADPNFMDPQNLEQDNVIGYQGGDAQLGISNNGTNAVLAQVPGRYRYSIQLGDNRCWGFINLEDKTAPVCMPFNDEEALINYDIDCDGVAENFVNDPSGVDDLADEYILCSLVEQNGFEIYFDELEARDRAFDLDGDGNPPYNADGTVNDPDDLVADCDGDGTNESSVCGDFFDCTGIESIYHEDETIDVCELADLQGLSIDQSRYDNTAFEVTTVYRRTWFAIDKNGFASQNGCTQQVIVLRPKVPTIELPQEVEIDCTEDVAGIELLSAPRFNVNNRIFNNGTGSDGPQFYNTDNDDRTPPVLAAIKLYYLEAGTHTCKYSTTYHEDPIIDVCTGSTKQTRHWSVLDWCDGGRAYSDFTQLLKVTDSTAPDLISENGFPLFVDGAGVTREDRGSLGTPAYTINLGLQLFDCDAAGNLPDFTLTDDCSQVEFSRVTIERMEDTNTHDVGEIFINNFLDTEPVNGDLTELNLPSGNYIVTYFFTDDCGNANEIPVPLFFEDNRVPQPICNDELVVTLVPTGTEGDQRARVYPEDLDDTSRDACFPLIYEVRLGDGSNQAWGEHVEFDCSDVIAEDEEPTVRVELRVTEDRNGNFRIDAGELSNICWTYIRVEDKTVPVIGVDNGEFLCDDPALNALQLNQGTYIPDADNTDALFPTILGGCSSAGITIDLLEVDTRAYDPICRIGVLVRRFRAVRTIHGNEIESPEVTQTITVRYNSDWTMEFPADILVECDDNADSNLDNIPAPLRVEEIITNRGCDQWGMEVEDDIFDIIGQDGDGACFKIIRTYKFINWCTWDPTNTEEGVVIRPLEFFTNPLLSVTLDYRSASVLNLCDLQNDIDDRFERSNDPYDVKIGNDGDNVAEFDDAAGLYETDADWIYFDEEAFGGGAVDFFNSGDCIEDDFNALSQSFIDAPSASTPANSLIDDQQIHTFVSAEAYGYFIYRQIIKVNDTQAPIVEEIDDFVVCDSTNVNGNCTANVTFPIPSVIECKPTYDINWELFAFDAATVTLAGQLADDNAGNFTPLTLSNIPYGTHRLRYIVADGCGNSTVTDFEFTVQDCKAPTAYCLTGVNIELMPGGMVEIWASDLDAGSFDDCSEPVTLSFSPNPADSGLVFTCGQRGTNFVRLWVTDAAGNQSFCETLVIVQDNDRDCQGGAAITTLVQTEMGDHLEDVTIRLNGESTTTLTNDLTQYNLTGLTAGADYTVSPEKDINYLNGVSTFDLVLMRKHIIGTAGFASPYQIIAADVNNSRSITTLDMVQLRRLILGMETEFANNTSWRFVDATYVFPNPANPWMEDFPEVANFNNLEAEVANIADFIAVKVGDVNNSATPNTLLGSDERTSKEALVFNVNNANVNAGEEVTVDFTADMADIAGYQFTLNFNQDALELVEIVEGAATTENFGTALVNEGIITTSFDGKVAKDEVLFSLTFAAKVKTTLSEAIQVSSAVTTAEAYRGTELLSVALNFDGTTQAAGYELYQNTPNPFYGQTFIGFNLPTATNATLTIRDVNGKTLRVIQDNFAAGLHRIELDQATLGQTSAILYYTLETADFTATRKMIVVQ